MTLLSETLSTHAAMQSIIEMLHSIHPLGQEARADLEKLLKPAEIKKKGFLLIAGQVSRRLCYIEKGLLRSFHQKGDTEVTTWFLKEGDVSLAMSSFFDQVPSQQFIQALEDTCIYYLTYDELHTLYREHSELNLIARVLTERYYRLWTEQHHAMKMRTAAERYQWLIEHHGDLILRVPAKFIASYLGITEVTLSRIRTQQR